MIPQGEALDWPFYSYLSVLSGLYIAGLSHIYVYGDTVPRGQWWAGLKDKEKVTFVVVSTSHVKLLSHPSEPSLLEFDQNNVRAVFEYLIKYKAVM